MMGKEKIELIEMAKKRHPGKVVCPCDGDVSLRQGFRIRRASDDRCWFSLRYNVDDHNYQVSMQITKEQADKIKL